MYVETVTGKVTVATIFGGKPPLARSNKDRER